MFGWVGHRPQYAPARRARAGVRRDACERHHEVAERDQSAPTSSSNRARSSAATSTRYQTSDVGQLSRLNIGKPTYQRGPGESTGSFAIESAMDELSYALAIDPLELRLRNYSETDPDSGKPYSSKRLRECYARGAERFGWSAGKPNARSTRRERMLVGLGMATASRATHRSAATVRIRMNPDGSVVVQCGTIEQGTGSPTVFAQLAAEILDVPFERVRFECGQTRTCRTRRSPPDPQTAASVGSAVVGAAQDLRRAPRATGGGRLPRVSRFSSRVKPAPGEAAFATQSFGAQFAEVEVDPDLGDGPRDALRRRLRRRPHPQREDRAKSDARRHRVGHQHGALRAHALRRADRAHHECQSCRIIWFRRTPIFPTSRSSSIEGDDPHVNPAGVKGIGEVGICGAAAAVANAVYHATGVRVRELPITPDKLI